MYYNASNIRQGIKSIASLHVDLSGVPESAFEAKTSPDGRRYYTLSYRVEISVQSSLEFSLVVKGVRYGSVTAKYA